MTARPTDAAAPPNPSGPDAVNDLARLPLFAGIGRADLQLLAGRLDRIDLPAGATLIAADQPGEFAYVILAGTLRVHLIGADGNEVTLALLGPGEVVGEMALIDDDVRSASVAALEPVALLRVDRAAFAYCRQHVPRVIDNLIRIMARRLRHTNAQVLALAALDVPGRVARQLLLLAEAYGRPEAEGVRDQLCLTQEDLAHLVGATRVRVNQAIGEFRRAGIVSIDAQHRYVIHDAAALERYV